MQHIGGLMRTTKRQMREGRQRARRRGSKGDGDIETDKIGQMMRRLREWEERILAQFRTATDALIADRLGIGIREGYHWEWGSTDAGYTEVLRRLYDSKNPINPEGGKIARNDETECKVLKDGTRLLVHHTRPVA